MALRSQSDRRIYWNRSRAGEGEVRIGAENRRPRPIPHKTPRATLHHRAVASTTHVPSACLVHPVWTGLRF